MNRDFEGRVFNFFDEGGFFEGVRKVLVGFSGGGDSVCLVELLTRYGLEVGLGYVNYGMRGRESEEERCWVEKFAYWKGLDLLMEDVGVMSGGNLQERARDIRIKFLKGMLGVGGYDCVCLGHNLDDQVETFFLRVIRGGGLRGLRCMSVKSEVCGLRILRPLLGYSREELRGYLKGIGENYWEDSSNRGLGYARNRLRNGCLGYLEGVWGGYRGGVKRVMGEISRVVSYMEKEVYERIEGMGVYEGLRERVLDIEKFRSEEELLREEIVRELGRSIGGVRLRGKELKRVIEEVDGFKGEGSKIFLERGGFRVIGEYGYLSFEKEYEGMGGGRREDWEVDIGVGGEYSWIRGEVDLEVERGGFELGLGKGLKIDVGKVIGRVYMRGIRGGDWVHMGYGRNRRKRLKELLIDRKLPRRKRKEVICIGDEWGLIGFMYPPPFLYMYLNEEYYINEGSYDIIRIEVK